MTAIGFAALPADVRAAAMDAAAGAAGVDNFFDLDPEQRRAVYDQATDAYWHVGTQVEGQLYGQIRGELR